MPVKTGNSNPKTQMLGLVKLSHNVLFTSGGAIDEQTPVAASGITVSRTAAGKLTLAFAEAWNDCVFIDALIYNQGNARGQFMELAEKWSSANKTVKIHIVADDGTNEDVSDGDELWLRCSMINTGSGLSIETA